MTWGSSTSSRASTISTFRILDAITPRCSRTSVIRVKKDHAANSPRRLAFGFTPPQAFLVDFAHEFAFAEHADDLAPILARMFVPFFRNDLLQGLDSFCKEFQGYVIHWWSSADVERRESQA